MTSLNLVITSALIFFLFLSGCRQIFGDGEQPESIVQAPSESSQIFITAPEQGSIWKPGDVIKIKWLAVSINHIDIQIYKKSAYQFTIIQNIDNTGTFDWLIPIDINLSNQYLIKILNHNTPDVYQFSGRFGIQ
jgi:hypothetical protein